MYDAVFDEDLELENFVISGAPYGGAIGMRAYTYNHFVSNNSIIALYRDESKLQRYKDPRTAKSGIDIYSSSGNHISRINV